MIVDIAACFDVCSRDQGWGVIPFIHSFIHSNQTSGLYNIHITYNLLKKVAKQLTKFKPIEFRDTITALKFTIQCFYDCE